MNTRQWYFITSQDSPTDDRVEDTLSSMEKDFTKEEYQNYSIYIAELTSEEISSIRTNTFDMVSVSNTNPLR